MSPRSKYLVVSLACILSIGAILSYSQPPRPSSLSYHPSNCSLTVASSQTSP